MPALDAALGEKRTNVGGAERWASIAGGAALIINALARPSVTNALLAAGGVALVQRGVTGHCMLYDALGIDTANRAEPERPRVTYGYGKRGATSIGDEVEHASELSFPASDPPAWISTSSLGGPSDDRRP